MYHLILFSVRISYYGNHFVSAYLIFIPIYFSKQRSNADAIIPILQMRKMRYRVKNDRKQQIQDLGLNLQPVSRIVMLSTLLNSLKCGCLGQSLFLHLCLSSSYPRDVGGKMVICLISGVNKQSNHFALLD